MIVTNKINYIHLRAFLNGAVQAKGGITIAWRMTEDESLEYGVAFCCLNDHYNKVTGRDLSTQRLVSKSVNFDTITKQQIFDGLIQPERLDLFATTAFADQVKALFVGKTISEVLKYGTVEELLKENTSQFANRHFIGTVQRAGVSFSTFHAAKNQTAQSL